MCNSPHSPMEKVIRELGIYDHGCSFRENYSLPPSSRDPGEKTKIRCFERCSEKKRVPTNSSSPYSPPLIETGVPGLKRESGE